MPLDKLAESVEQHIEKHSTWYLAILSVEDARNSVESGGSPEPPVYAALACDSGGCGRSFSSAASSFGRSR